MSEAKLLSEREVFWEYGLGISWLRRRRGERRGPRFLKLERMVRYKKADIEEYLRSRVVEIRNEKAMTDS